MPPAKILFTIPNFITAGSGRAMLNIIERLDPARFAPAVAVLSRGGLLDTEVERLGIPLIEANFTVPAQPYTTLLLRAWKAALIFRPYRFALWHSFHYSDDYTEPLIARLAGAKAFIYTKKNMSWGSNAWKIRSFLASAIPCQNQDMLTKFFASPLFSGKARYISPGVDTMIFHPEAEPVLDMRSRLGIARENLVITCVAELVPVKGHPFLLDAIALVPDVHLLLAGRPSDELHCQKLYHQAEVLGISQRVHFLGRIENIPALLAETDIFVLATITRGEGCGIAVLEAMACAKACVATNVPGPHDYIQHGKNGLLAKPEDAQSLAQAFQILIADSDLRIRLGQAAQRRIESYYTIEREVEDYTRLYQEKIRDRLA